MTAFPKPPPLKQKPEQRSLPKGTLSHIANPSLATQLVIVSGVISMTVAFLAGLGVYLLLRPALHAWKIPDFVSYAVLILFSLYAFSLGFSAVQRAIVDALNSDE